MSISHSSIPTREGRWLQFCVAHITVRSIRLGMAWAQDHFPWYLHVTYAGDHHHYLTGSWRGRSRASPREREYGLDIDLEG